MTSSHKKVTVFLTHRTLATLIEISNFKSP